MKLQDATSLKTNEEYTAALLELIEQASRTIRIRSSHLDRDLFNQAEINDALSAFARRSRYCTVEVLIDYPDKLSQYRCLTLELARRLSEKFSIKEHFDEENHGRTDSFVLIDSRGILIKPIEETKTGFYSLTDSANTKGMVETFEHEWGMSQIARQLRQLNMG